jgi:DNA-binding Lrp family transcriptional regulator
MADVDELDGIDLRLLELLREDGRQSVSTLARESGVSRATAYARLEKLGSSGVVEGFTVRTNPKRLGLGVSAFILLSFRQGDWRELRATFAAMPEIENFVLTTGTYDALMLVRMPDIEALRRFLLDRVQATPGVRGSQTILVLEEVTNRPFVLPPGREGTVATPPKAGDQRSGRLPRQ